jgi:hypothetical protein
MANALWCGQYALDHLTFHAPLSIGCAVALPDQRNQRNFPCTPPINIDPKDRFRSPSTYYATYLAKLPRVFHAGMAEDTWALNERHR